MKKRGGAGRSLFSAALVLAALGSAFVPCRAARAAADDTKAETKEKTTAARGATVGDAKQDAAPTTLGHAGQFNVRADLSSGYRMLFRYDHSPPCAPWNTAKTSSDQQKFCGVGMPVALGVAVGYALADFFEPFVFGRFGLSDEAKTNSGAPLVLGAGARLYTMSEDRFKIFFSPWAAVDLTSGPAGNGPDFAPYGSKADDYKTDLLLHIDAGPQFEISRNVGIYASGGLTFGMLRYLSTNAELALGVELRAP